MILTVPWHGSIWVPMVGCLGFLSICPFRVPWGVPAIDAQGTYRMNRVVPQRSHTWPPVIHGCRVLALAPWGAFNGSSLYGPGSGTARKRIQIGPLHGPASPPRPRLSASGRPPITAPWRPELPHRLPQYQPAPETRPEPRLGRPRGIPAMLGSAPPVHAQGRR